MSIRDDKEFMEFFWEESEDEFIYYYKDGVSWIEFAELKEKLLDHIDKYVQRRMPIN